MQELGRAGSDVYAEAIRFMRPERA
jgi:hypothetical protein